MTSVASFLARVQKAWDEFNAYIDSLGEEQLTQPTDAAGWTAKDHLIHLAVWENGCNGMLRGGLRRETMGLDPEAWQSGDYDRMNAIIRERHKDMSLADARAMMATVHEELVGRVSTLSDADLKRPYRYYEPSSSSNVQVITVLAADTYEHYKEHRPWIEAIVKGA